VTFSRPIRREILIFFGRGNRCDQGTFGGKINVVRVITLIVVAATLHTAAFAQKPLDPEARNKRAVSVAEPRANPTGVRRTPNSAEPHRSQPQAASVSKAATSTARDLAKVERASVQQMKTTHKANKDLKTASSASPAIKPQSSNKPIKFSYHPPQAAGKNSVKNPPPAPVRSHPIH
jgi:hypothetical protein